MPRTKISTLNLRIDPNVKAAVQAAAEREHRSVANMVEVLIRRHCEQSGIPVNETNKTRS
ncbi:MAG: ribbon-helix-helix protein, CopG family [Woeseiaceae bacterium]|nr:ribbon-helix-helix protein, CopG family [Woeseiaceae bacterium]